MYSALNIEENSSSSLLKVGKLMLFRSKLYTIYRFVEYKIAYRPTPRLECLKYASFPIRFKELIAIIVQEKKYIIHSSLYDFLKFYFFEVGLSPLLEPNCDARN